MELLHFSTPSPTTCITSFLDALKEAAGLENDSPAFKKCIESLETRVFGDLQEGAMRDRVAKLEFEILYDTCQVLEGGSNEDVIIVC
eukprot:2985258-Ditylum_brightwellii.AAC.1